MLEEFSQVSNYSGCSNLGQAQQQEVTPGYLAKQLWNYVKNKGFNLPSNPVIDRIEVGTLIPDSIEPVVINVLSQKIDQYAQEQLGAPATVDGIAGTVSIQIVEGAYQQLLQLSEVSQSQIDSGQFPSAFEEHPEWIYLYAMSNSGPFAGGSRQIIVDKLKKLIKSGLVSVLDALGLMPPPKRGNVSEWQLRINKEVDEVIGSVNLSQYDTPENARKAIWPSVQSRLAQKFQNYVRDPFINFIMLTGNQRLLDTLEKHYNYDFAWNYDPSRGVVVGDRKPFQPGGGDGAGAGAGSGSILPIALAAGAVALLVLKK